MRSATAAGGRALAFLTVIASESYYRSAALRSIW